MTQTAALDKAFKLFHEKKYDNAHAAFKSLIDDVDTPTHVRNRLLHFSNICDQQIAGDGPDLRADQLTVSYFLNVKNVDKAEALLADSDLAPERIAFFRAEIAVLRNDLTTAAAELRKAIDLDRSNRGYAINSPTFMGLLQNEQFAFLQSEDDD